MSQRDEVPPQEDILGDEEVRDEEEEEGEDLLGEGMAADYEPRPELDRYDPDMLDEGEHSVITLEQRRAAEREMAQRDRASRRRQRSPQTPRFPVAPSSPEHSSDAEPLSPPTPGSAMQRRKRPRSEPTASPGGQSEQD